MRTSVGLGGRGALERGRLPEVGQGRDGGPGRVAEHVAVDERRLRDARRGRDRRGGGRLRGLGRDGPRQARQGSGQEGATEDRSSVSPSHRRPILSAPAARVSPGSLTPRLTDTRARHWRWTSPACWTLSARFDLGLGAEDESAIREARRGRFVLDREAALVLIADALPLVDAAVRRRPVLSGPPFTLPGHEEPPGLVEPAGSGRRSSSRSSARICGVSRARGPPAPAGRGSRRGRGGRRPSSRRPCLRPEDGADARAVGQLARHAHHGEVVRRHLRAERRSAC